ncbi:hypothetical protein IMSAGC006_01652 [Muribaculaceae bacterium]|nr:hypothetical protein IMSAGC006_01652 [Muribaculaceae bacterium]
MIWMWTWRSWESVKNLRSYAVFKPGKALYANFDLGYDYATGVEGGGFAYEIGAGFVLNKHVSLGLVWEGNSAKWEDSYYGDWYEFTSKWGMFGVKFGVQF